MNKSKVIKARPQNIPVVCVAKEYSSVLNLARCLSKAGKRGIKSSSLIYVGGLCLGLELKTALLKELLPEICEHSDAVCIGRGYPELFEEHGLVLINQGALEKLSSKL